MYAHSVSELLERCSLDNDGAAWQEFVRRCGKRIGLLLEAILYRAGLEPCEEDIEELAQELYVRLLCAGRRTPGCFRGRSDDEVWSYLTVVARRLVSNRIRAASTGKRQQATPCPSMARAAGLTAAEQSPEEWTFTNQLLRLFLERCRDELRDGNARRQIIVLRLACLEGWSSREIAHILGGVTPQGVDSLVRRIRRRFVAQGLRLPRRRRRHPAGQAGPSAAAIAAVAGW